MIGTAYLMTSHHMDLSYTDLSYFPYLMMFERLNSVPLTSNQRLNSVITVPQTSLDTENSSNPYSSNPCDEISLNMQCQSNKRTQKKEEDHFNSGMLDPEIVSALNRKMKSKTKSKMDCSGRTDDDVTSDGSEEGEGGREGEEDGEKEEEGEGSSTGDGIGLNESREDQYDDRDLDLLPSNSNSIEEEDVMNVERNTEEKMDMDSESSDKNARTDPSDSCRTVKHQHGHRHGHVDGSGIGDGKGNGNGHKNVQSSLLPLTGIWPIACPLHPTKIVLTGLDAYKVRVSESEV